MSTKSAPRDDGFRAAAADPSLDAAMVGSCSPPMPEGAAIGQAAAPSPSSDPVPPVTGTELEAEDRALLYTENARLKRLAEALYRENRRHGDEGKHVLFHFPWVRRAFINGECSAPLLYDGSYLKLNRQVEDEFAEIKRKQLARKQCQDKED
jgi:hypothetical protein